MSTARYIQSRGRNASKLMNRSACRTQSYILDSRLYKLLKFIAGPWIRFMPSRLSIYSLVLFSIGGLALANADDYSTRSQELYADHTEYRDMSLRFGFWDLLLGFENSYEKWLEGGIPKEAAAFMGIREDERMSEEGVALLRQAAARETDELTADLRNAQPVRDRLCAAIEQNDPVELGGLAHDAFWATELPKIDRYEGLLERLSPEDRALLDAVYFNQAAGQMRQPKLPVNDKHIRDQLYGEFPEVALEQAERECNRHQITKGAYFIVTDDTEKKALYDDNGKVYMVTATGGREYTMVTPGDKRYRQIDTPETQSNASH